VGAQKKTRQSESHLHQRQQQERRLVAKDQRFITQPAPVYTGGQNKDSVSGPGSLDCIKTVSAGERGKVFAYLDIGPPKAEVLRQEVRWLDTHTTARHQRRCEYEVRGSAVSYS